MHKGSMIKMEQFEKIQEIIFELTGFSEVNKIERGYSFENKYLLNGGDGRNYLLRISQLTQKADAESKEEEFNLIKRVRRYSSLVPKAYFFGISDDDSLCYMVLDYIHGADGEEAIMDLNRDQQYELGLDAGNELVKLHGMNAPFNIGLWHERFPLKYARKCAIFDKMNINTRIIDMEKLSCFVSEHDCHMKCRRQSFLHDDYHLANLIIRDGRLHGIIDFNRHDWGDPVHDFVKLAYFSSAVSIPFSAGQIDGYNGGEVSAEFWKKYSLYLAMAIIPDIVWSHWYSKEKGSPEQVERMWERVNRVYLDHDGFSEEIPQWYMDFKDG
jgi:aminoglycoside phosphotransferase (APT) family kinase protein